MAESRRPWTLPDHSIEEKEGFCRRSGGVRGHSAQLTWQGLVCALAAEGHDEGVQTVALALRVQLSQHDGMVGRLPHCTETTKCSGGSRGEGVTQTIDFYACTYSPRATT